jgi:BMFP domain-containing protein YqiC
VDKNIINELAGKLADAVPADLSGLRDDVESNFRGLLQSGLNKLDLVTRDEFDVQRKVLERTRDKLERLENELIELQRDTIGEADTDKNNPGTAS